MKSDLAIDETQGHAGLVSSLVSKMHHWVAIVTDVPWPWASQQHGINPLNRKQAKKQLFTLELHTGTFMINLY